MTSILLVGGGRHAHNIIGLVEDAGWLIEAVLDDDHGRELLGYPVIAFDGYQGAARDAVLSVGDPTTKRDIIDRISFPVRWMSFIHPQSILSRHATIGPGAFVAPMTTVADVAFAEQVTILPFTMIGARVAIGAFSLVSSHCAIHSDASIGSDTLIGSHVIVMAGVRIGSRCRIASGSIVRHDVPDDHLVAGRDRPRMLARPRADVAAEA